MPPADPVIEMRLKATEEGLSEVREAIKSIAQSLQTLAAVEIHHAETRDGLQRAFEEIRLLKVEKGQQDERIRGLEMEMPILKLTSRAARGVGWAVILAVLAAVLALVIKQE